MHPAWTALDSEHYDAIMTAGKAHCTHVCSIHPMLHGEKNRGDRYALAAVQIRCFT